MIRIARPIKIERESAGYWICISITTLKNTGAERNNEYEELSLLNYLLCGNIHLGGLVAPKKCLKQKMCVSSLLCSVCFND